MRSQRAMIQAKGRKRLEKFAALVRRIAVTDDSAIIHETRVLSRRLQEVVKVLAPQATKQTKQRKLVRALRKLREVLGRPRNFDVMLKLVEEKLACAGNPAARSAWEHVRASLNERRADAFERARKELADFEIVDFAARCRTMVNGGGREPSEVTVKRKIAEALDQWREAIVAAKAEPGVDELHKLRVAGKRLRYRLELIQELDDSATKAQIKSLRALQDQLGSWHDSEVLLQTCAKFLRRRDFLASYPGLARALLVEMDCERRRANGAIEGLVTDAENASRAFGHGASARVAVHRQARSRAHRSLTRG